jgi:hypothetical protein
MRETRERTCRLRGGEITRKGGEDTMMKKALMLMFALVIGLSFGAATFVQAGDKPAETKPDDTKKADTKKADTKKDDKKKPEEKK